MSIRLSTRISIRWSDDPPSEPTNTIVLSVGSYFMDLRITKVDKSIDWAFAGTREILARDPLHCRWYHIIDSRGSFDPDEGKFKKLPNGDDLETGSMPCPEKGNQVTPYEEVWRELQPTVGRERGWILQMQEGNCNKFIGKYGGVFLAMSQDDGKAFSVRKEDLVDGEAGLKWALEYEYGVPNLPSLSNMELMKFPGETDWRLGDRVAIGNETYEVRALVAQ
ncbi:hypothetical protein BS50DRAFT_582503 [Corynespora cassiicola Philippines]|uniref:Protein HRI1 n=1 Tax=Corynespora cassiicola Philippines TaxID=1448308 RepID=A0A2T2P5H6_CORCC|nr:hypothetical protein BS50DRAFT_582503 [Corynespora cassiicola Philippines]